jgi:hypothetical protein
MIPFYLDKRSSMAVTILVVPLFRESTCLIRLTAKKIGTTDCGEKQKNEEPQSNKQESSKIE